MGIGHIKNMYFLGIGGIGMSALARYFNQLGVKVSGYDKTQTILTNQLQTEGIDIHFEDDPSLIPVDIEMVVYTPAIPKEIKVMKFVEESNIPLYKRSQILGEITKDKFTIAIAGTHGKTTISSILAHILNHAGIKVTALIGGILNNYNSNFIGQVEGDVFVVEADEYDRSFLTLHPNMALIASMDADHLDVYGSKNQLLESFEMFAKNTKKDGVLVLKKGLKLNFDEVKIQSYSLLDEADFNCSRFELGEGAYSIDLKLEENNIYGIDFNTPGRHNVENAVAASALASIYGLSTKQIKDGLENYPGVKRRFEIILKKKDLIYIDDYAHHPEELKACILSVKELYPEKKITGIFQPHLFSRTRDFADEFAQSLALLDELIIMDIYPARETPIVGIDAQFLLDKINLTNKFYLKRDEIPSFILKQKPEVLLTLGAGNIDQLVEPLKQIFTIQ